MHLDIKFKVLKVIFLSYGSKCTPISRKSVKLTNLAYNFFIFFLNIFVLNKFKWINLIQTNRKCFFQLLKTQLDHLIWIKTKKKHIGNMGFCYLSKKSLDLKNTPALVWTFSMSKYFLLLSQYLLFYPMKCIWVPSIKF